MTPERRSLQVEITEADIRSAMRRSFRQCPLARALNRQYPLAHPPIVGWGVGPERAWSGEDGWVLSRAAQRFVRRYDHAEPVTGMTFRIRRMTEEEEKGLCQ